MQLQRAVAAIQRERNGTYSASWRNAEGQRVTVSTGEVLVERAAPRAARLEAESRFWEDHGAEVWQRLADAAFSPRYLHSIFTCRAHIPFPEFRKLLLEANVKFKAPACWRDRTKPRGKSSDRKWRLGDRMLTLDELMERADEDVTRAALRFRLTAGWPVQDAISKPRMSRSESGLLGANIINKARQRS